ncbi:hypothetical protein LPB140_06230 [Sphingorhabdus lutea]|uniref:Preprotein translocase subunit YajC n=1 Tax=Sphingorhabdus lutea TaxID=1913578 RepID=A0A1L3JBL6_9SPHN|nr:hypothetical protein [Sphingorhabdus lutea]APG62453.1 hypothetical protein LPB140_06230 [Sphingorhabdus lutea]
MSTIVKIQKIAFIMGVATSPLVVGQASAQQLSADYSGYVNPAPSNADSGDDASSSSNSKSTRKGGKKSGPHVDVTPYLEVTQVAFTDFKDGSSDVLTYSTIAAGVDASIQTNRAEAQMNVRYERVIGYDDGIDSQDNISGLARGSYRVNRALSVEAGGIATRSRIDGRGASPTNIVGSPDNISQVYSIYAGPTLSTNVGELGVNAAYRVGYTKLESRDVGTLPNGQQPISAFDDSVSQAASVSVGIQPGDLPVGWAVGAGWSREDAGQLDQRFDSKYVRGDITVPVSPTLAVVGGVGYEDIKVSERDALRDVNNDPIRGNDGRLVTDPSSPRLVAYQSDGIFWDAGVLWRPSSRTSLEARYGRRYDSDTYIASINYQPNANVGANISVYDTVTGFGNLINDSLSNLPTQFSAYRNPISGDIGGCAFGASGGSCFGQALQSASSAAFRSRGVTGSVAMTDGDWNTGVAAGYARRRFLASNIGAQAELSGNVDQNYFASIFVGRTLDEDSRIESNFYGNYFIPGFAGSNDVIAVGANAAYYRQIFRGLSASAAVGVDAQRQVDFDSQITGSALVGLRYSF